jgi:hypothetical protein
VSWDLEFYEPIRLPRRKPLLTLRDAAIFITSFPKSEQAAEHWRPAAVLLKLIGENGGCVVLARLGVRHGLRKASRMIRRNMIPIARAIGHGENANSRETNDGSGVGSRCEPWTTK